VPRGVLGEGEMMALTPPSRWPQARRLAQAQALLTASPGSGDRVIG
jgi:hypothetical protein